MIPQPQPQALKRDDLIRRSQDRCRSCDVRALSICDGQPEESLLRLAAISTPLHAPPRAVLIEEGEPAQHVFTVTAGMVKAFKLMPDGRRQIVGFLTTGDFLGLATADRYGYSVESVSSAALCRFSRGQLEALFDDFPGLERRLRQKASHELAEAQDLMLLLGRKTAQERIATFLLRLRRRLEEIGAPCDPLPLPMSRAEIADYLGLTTETVSRAFTHLRRAGLIAAGTGDASVLDLVGLRRLADGD